MSKRETVDFETCKRNHFKVLLFADNREHMQLLHRIQRHEQTRDKYCGCWHIEKDDSAQEIVQGHGKKHCHLIVSFPNPRGWRAVCTMLQADRRFLRPIGVDPVLDVRKAESLKGGYQYLLHANAPEKGVISGDKLFGADWMVQAALQACCEALAKNVSMAACVQAVSVWIDAQGCKIIKTKDLVTWLASTPYFKAQQSRLTYQMMNEHNEHVKREIAKERARREAEMRERDWIEHLVPPPECEDNFWFPEGAVL